MSEVAVLNVGAGDVKLTFDKSNPAERIRAARICKDMLRRGYSLLIEVERDGKKLFERALDFDETKCEYIIADFDPVAAILGRKEAEEAEMHAAEIERQKGDQHHGRSKDEAPAASKGSRGTRGRRKGVPVEGTRAVAVGR